ncbi:MAG: FAD-dependent oxidoreductase, partial [bacterium]|nr:FAD-dependent oxidoreductase [bacterium]
TNLKWSAQKELVHSIPGLKDANIDRYGDMHRNTFINSSVVLNPTFESKTRQGLFFAGQITGTEGYTESIAGGLLSGINMAKRILGENPIIFPKESMLGALSNYITDKAHLAHTSKRDGSLKYLPPQPINSNWAIVEPIELPKNERKNKKLKAELMAQRSIKILEEIKTII